MNCRLLVVFLFLTTLTLAEKQITTIKGYAPAYVGKEVNVIQILDYLTVTEERIASVFVQSDSTFSCSFYLEETKKIILESANNRCFLYVQPGGKYDIFLPNINLHDPYRPAGNLLEVTFFNLDSSDINYKLLEFNRWSDEFIAKYYTKSNADKGYFVHRLDTFKSNVAAYYQKDTANKFLMSHIRFSLAKIDDMRYLGARNQYEKYDFYLKYTPVNYQSDTYMEYILHFYEKLLPRIANETNNKIYQGIIASSPSKIMQAMGLEYTLINNIRLREVVMLKLLSEAYFDKDFPQTNILTVLDSVSKFARFESNKLIAANLIKRLTELSIGGRAPDFSIPLPAGDAQLSTFQGKYLYLMFMDPEIEGNTLQLELLKPIYERYKHLVQFVAVFQTEKSAQDPSSVQVTNKMAWSAAFVPSTSSIIKNYQVQTTPYFVLIDPFGYVVNAPALGPVPNGQYQTIDQVFYQIDKVLKEEKK